MGITETMVGVVVAIRHPLQVEELVEGVQISPLKAVLEQVEVAQAVQSWEMS